jgi:hypothetical protein
MSKLRQLIFPVLFCLSSAVLGQHSELEDTVRLAALKGGDNAGFSVSVYSPAGTYNVESGLRKPKVFQACFHADFVFI